MKNIIFLFLFVCLFTNNIQAQNPTSLYLIYDPNTPPITKDVSKYYGRSTPEIVTSYTHVGANMAYYSFELPLNSGRRLDFEPIEGLPMIEIPISQLLTQYPQAKTLQQLDQELEPLRNIDYQHTQTILAQYPNGLPYGKYNNNTRVKKYFQDVMDDMYIIDLNHHTQKARIIKVRFW